MQAIFCEHWTCSYLCQGKEVMFSPCLSVCLSVSLSARLLKKLRTDLDEISLERWGVAQGLVGQILVVICLYVSASLCMSVSV